MARFRMGYSAIDWGPDRFLPALREISDLGFAGVEVGTEVVMLYEGRQDEFAELLSRVDLELAGVLAGLVLTDPAYRESDLEIARASARLLRGVPGRGALVVVPGETEGTREASLRNAGEALREIAGVFEGERPRVCVKPQRGSAVESGDDLAALLAETEGAPEVGVCFDSAHLVLSGTDVELFCAAHAGAIGHVHLTDLRGEMVEDLSPLAEHGKGTISLPDIVDVLRATPYEGWVIGRVDTPERAPGDAAAACSDYFQRTLFLPPRGSDRPA